MENFCQKLELEQNNLVCIAPSASDDLEIKITAKDISGNEAVINLDYSLYDEFIKGSRYRDRITGSELDYIALSDLLFEDLSIMHKAENTIIENTNSDFSIEFNGIIDLSESDFIFS